MKRNSDQSINIKFIYTEFHLNIGFIFPVFLPEIEVNREVEVISIVADRPIVMLRPWGLEVNTADGEEVALRNVMTTEPEFEFTQILIHG